MMNNKFNAIVSKRNFTDTKKTGSLAGLVYAAKDNISTLSLPTKGSSLFLNDYTPPFDATVIKLLNDAGAELSSKTTMDEFGLGGLGLFAATGPVINPLDPTRITGGSTSGGAVVQALNEVDFSIGTDTGDSIRKPASYLGILGYKPSYGAISRYGVFPYAPSLDHVGLFAKNLEIMSQVLAVLIKNDPNDFTSNEINFNPHFKLKTTPKCAVFKDFFKVVNNNCGELITKFFERNKLNFNFNELNPNLELLKLILPVYRAISYSEAVSCYSNLIGITFGKKLTGPNFETAVIQNRSKHLGSQIKKRFLVGSWATSQENYNRIYAKAVIARKHLEKYTNDILEKHDFLILPAALDVASKIGEINRKKLTETEEIVDNILVLANFAGLPSLTIPIGKVNNLPFGLNIVSRYGNDEALIAFARSLI